MFSNDLNNAYEYERERRNDERRAATESQRVRGLVKRRSTSPIALAGILAVLVTLMHEL
jgi:hypothetical protein